MLDVSTAVIFDCLVFVSVPLAVSIVFQKLRWPLLPAAVLSGVIIGNLPVLSTQTIYDMIGRLLLILFFWLAGLYYTEAAAGQSWRAIWISIAVQLLSAAMLSLLCFLFGLTFRSALLIGWGLSFGSGGLITLMLYRNGATFAPLGETVSRFWSAQLFTGLIFLIFLSHTANWSQFAINILLLGSLWVGVSTRSVHIGVGLVRQLSTGVRDGVLLVGTLAVGWLLTLFGYNGVIAALVAGIVLARLRSAVGMFAIGKSLQRWTAVGLAVFIGTQINVATLFSHPLYIVFFFVSIVVIKWLTTLTGLMFFGFSSGSAFALMAYLLAGGEITLVLLNLNTSFLTADARTLALTAIAASLTVQPFLSQHAQRLYYALRQLIGKRIHVLDIFLRHRIDSVRLPTDAVTYKNHVLICGYARVGNQIARALELANIPFVVIEPDYEVSRRAKASGLNVVYGDPTDPEMLVFAKIRQAVALVNTLPDLFSQEQILLAAKKFNPQMVTLACVQSRGDQQRLRDLGAEVVVEPESQAVMTLVKDLFYLWQMPKQTMRENLKYFKLEMGID